MDIVELYFLVPVFFILSLIQSIFGVGLLIFGTPILLLFGYSYIDALQLLLPSSLAISVFQVFWSRQFLSDVKKIVVVVVPALAIGMILVLRYSSSSYISKIIGFFLVFIWAIRTSNYIQNILLYLINQYKYPYIMIMGLVHGISNMGGGLLTNLMLSLHQDKNIIRVNIAMIYMIFASSQLIILIIMNGFAGWPEIYPLILLSLTVFFIFGRSIAYRINNNVYQIVISYFILLFGLLSFL